MDTPKEPGAEYVHHFFNDRLGVSEAKDADHGIFIWHLCTDYDGGRWMASGVGNHTRTGGIEDLTLRASLLFPCCGMHGFLTDGEWVDA